MKVILFTVAGVQPMIGNVINEDDDFMNVEYPIVIMKEDSFLYTIPYIPFAKSGLVSFSRSNIISVAAVEDEVLEFYNSIVSEMKENKISFKKPKDIKKELIIKQKSLH